MSIKGFDIDPERKVLNTKDPDEKTGFVIKTDTGESDRFVDGSYASVEFTDTSSSYGAPVEDEAVLSGQVKPEVLSVRNTGYDGKPNIYDPAKDKVDVTPNTASFDRTSAMGSLTRESYGTLRFFNNPADLIIGCVIAGLLIILEIVLIVILF